MNLLERVVRIRTGGTVERCHGIVHQGGYSNAVHTWGVLVLLYVLYPEDYARLSPAVLFHDVPEAWVGDIPASTKSWNKTVKLEVDRMERAIFEWLALPVDADLAPEDAAKVKACDSLELYLWAHEQVHGGNLHARCLIRELDAFYEQMPLPPPAGRLRRLLQDGGSVEHATDGVIRRLNQSSPPGGGRGP